MEAVPVRQFDDALSFSLQCLSRSDLTLKPKQREILLNLFAKRNVFAWLPTGYGKSICYQVLPFLLSSSSSAAGLVIVVSPLVSLMVEQTRALRKVGVKAAILSTAAGKVDKTPSYSNRGRPGYIQIAVLCTRSCIVQYMERHSAEQGFGRESCCSGN